MNDPDLARQRYIAVRQAKQEGIPKDDAWSTIQHDWGHEFEGHLLESTIDFVYDDTGGVDDE